jgi:hypothetical protein
VARALLEHETIDGEEVTRLIAAAANGDAGTPPDKADDGDAARTRSTTRNGGQDEAARARSAEAGAHGGADNADAEALAGKYRPPYPPPPPPT